MEILATIKPTQARHALDFWNCTRHFEERKARIARTGLGVGKVAAGFLVNKEHYNGLEEHYITTSGLIIVRNHETKKAVTVIIARAAQIRRYYETFGLVAPKAITQIANYNSKVRHLNY